MAMTLNRAICLGALLVGVVISPAKADDTTPQLVASVSGVTSYGDKTLDRAVNLIRESKKANEAEQRRRQIKPAIQDHIVRTRSNSDHQLILGIDGASSLPM